MASALLSRAFTGLRSVRSQAFHAPASPISSALFKRRASYSRSILPSFVSRGSGFICCIATASSSAGMTTSAEQAVAHSEPVVSADWLHANLRAPDVKVLDASWYMPDEQRNPLQEYQVAHIPGALFFDVDGISDRTSNLPHMLPSEKAFGAAVSALGIHNKDGVIVYDGKGIFSAARVWWMFRVFGHDKVWVLDGGLPQWRSSAYDVESSASGDAILKASAASEAIEKVYQGQLVAPPTFEAKFQPHLIWTLEQVKENIEAQTHQQIDARSKPRFDGTVQEPWKGIRSGHVPGSKCIPFAQMLDSSQMLLPEGELVKRFEQEGISLDRPVVTACGTGVTACILALENTHSLLNGETAAIAAAAEPQSPRPHRWRHVASPSEGRASSLSDQIGFPSVTSRDSVQRKALFSMASTGEGSVLGPNKDQAGPTEKDEAGPSILTESGEGITMGVRFRMGSEKVMLSLVCQPIFLLA